MPGAWWRCHSVSTLWTPDEVRVCQHLFRVTLPHKNQSAQTYRSSKKVCVYVCLMWSNVLCTVVMQQKKGFFPESLLMFSRIDPCQLIELVDWTHWKISHTPQPNAHTQGVLFNDWKVPLHLLTSHLHPHDIQYSAPSACQVATPFWALGRTHWLTCWHYYLSWQRCTNQASLDFWCVSLSHPLCHIVCLCLPVAPENANVGRGMPLLSPTGKAVPLLLHIAGSSDQPLIRLMSPDSYHAFKFRHKTAGSLLCCFPKPRTERPPYRTELANQ